MLSELMLWLQHLLQALWEIHSLFIQLKSFIWFAELRMGGRICFMVDLSTSS